MQFNQLRCLVSSKLQYYMIRRQSLLMVCLEKANVSFAAAFFFCGHTIYINVLVKRVPFRKMNTF